MAPAAAERTHFLEIFMKLGILALLVVGAAGIAGCEVGVQPPEAAVEVDAGAPVVWDSFYTGGHYDGAYWVWRDGDGHYFREGRAIHEHRLADPGHRGFEHHEEDHHEEHHEDHR
jgi:hypothetical protein